MVGLGSAFSSLARPPDLSVEYSGGSQVRLSWTNTSGIHVLEVADSLSPTNVWRQLAQIPTPSNGWFSVTTDITGASRFFRLRLQADGLPPDPSLVAPPVPQGVPTLLANAIEFLYTGTNAIQTNVAPGTIEGRRVAVVRGKVKERDNSPVSGVTISVLNHPEFGRTSTRADGMFDLVINGGGLLTLKYEKTDFCPVQRQVNVSWQDWAVVQDAVMVQMDPNVTAVALGTDSP